jgi:trimethylamine--corrinoid protein Co-methyltransferase
MYPKGGIFNILTDDQKQRIHNAAIEVLERTGVEFMQKEAVEIMHSAGASIYNGNTVRIPTFLIQEALNYAPSRATIYNREGDAYLYLCDDNYYFLSSPGVLNLIDFKTKKRRKITYEDLCKYARIIDSLKNIEIIGSWMISDYPANIADRYQAQGILLNTRKPFYLAPLSIEGLKDVIEMCEIIAGGEKALSQKPFFVTAANPIPPLRIPEVSIQKLTLMAEKRLPIIYNPIPILGATSPLDIFGTLVLLVSNNLAELVLSQQISKGTPVIFGGLSAPMDMKTGQMYYGGPEFNLVCGALAEMGHFYGLPIWGTGGCSSSKMLDSQAAIEITSSLMFSIFTGAHIIHDVGFLDNGLVSSFEIHFLCDEIISMVRKMTSGINIENSPDTINYIDRVGVNGIYLNTEETFKNFRELWDTKYMDHQAHAAWTEQGSLTMLDRINAKLIETINEYKPKQLDEHVANEIIKIVEIAAKQ